jgi:hypothetical protein
MRGCSLRYAYRGFARVQFDIVGMTGYPEVNFPIADYQGVGPFRQYRGVLER